jgi:hypothetical protein
LPPPTSALAPWRIFIQRRWSGRWAGRVGALRRDLLDDIATVLGGGPGEHGEGVSRGHPGPLRTLAPDWAAYRTTNGLEIRRYLETVHAVKVPTTGHKYPVAPAAIREAIARRAANRGLDGAP